MGCSSRAPLALAAVALAVAGASACTKPQPPAITSVKPTSVTADARGLSIGMTLGMHNPNGVAIPLQAVDAHVTAGEGIDLGTVRVPEAVTLPAKGDADVPVSLPVTWNGVGQMAMLAASGRDIAYRAEGTVTLGGDLLNVTVPFTATGTIKQQDLAQGALRAMPR
ncbi:MAG TPA: LEA type 2 family protein [Polyangiaceae bacterium]|nr:LEA type 2 family protein [Polyangiaceae bacterium]